MPPALSEYALLQLEHGQNFSAGGLAIVSPLTELTQEKGTKPEIGRTLKKA